MFSAQRSSPLQARGLPWLDVLTQDLRFTFRTLRRERGFAIVAVLILALGIGANVAVFSVVNTILLSPLPFPSAQQLVRIVEKNAKAGESSKTYTADATQDFQQQNRSFQSVSGYFAFTGPDNFKLVGNGQPLPVTGILVAENFFEALGVQPSVGRLFRHEEFVQHSRPVTLLSYPFWKRQLGGNRDIVGQAINMNGTPVTVVGVLPDTFDFGSVFSPGAKVDLFTPYIMDDFRDDGNDLAVIGRLKPGVTLARAQSEADQLFPQLYFEHKHPEYGKAYTGQLTELKEYVSGKLRRALVVLWCAVGLILLIVCVNLSNLLLARAAARNKEFAMRISLGAGRGRLVRQLLTESLVLSGCGALLGLALAYAATSWLAHQGAVALPLLSSVRVDGRALAWTLLIALSVGVLFGIVPGLKVSGSNLQESLKNAGPAMSEGRKHERVRATLVISEVALACVLLIGAGLLLRSFLRVLDVDLGFQPDHAAAIKIDYDDGGDRTRRGVILQEILRRVKALPGIEAAGVADMLPLDRNRSWGLAAKGIVESKEKNYDAFVYIVTPGYLDAMGMHLREGCDFSWQDTSKSEPVIIINEAAARREWPGESPLGRLAQGIGNGYTRVVGVIADVRESSLEDSSSPEVYVPTTQAQPEGAELVVRTKLPPDALASSVMNTLRSINPGQPATEFRPIQQLVDRAVSPRRFFVLLVAAFAVLGMVLASLGIYGVISYSVTRQTQEIGIRMALGATAGRVQAGIIIKTLRLALLGIAIGTVASFAVARGIASLLFGTEPTDPATFAGMILLLSAVAFLAGSIPARRASRINPMTALRGE